jgi:putative transposase
VKYRFIDEHRRQWPVRLMCQLLQVSAGGYYTWRDRPASAQQQRREVLKREIEAIHQQFKQRYGSPRIHEELQARGQRCCVNTVAKLMRQHGIAAKTKRKFRCTTDSNHDLLVADNILDRQFEPVAVNQVWVAEIV